MALEPPQDEIQTTLNNVHKKENNFIDNLKLYEIK